MKGCVRLEKEVEDVDTYAYDHDIDLLRHRDQKSTRRLQAVVSARPSSGSLQA